MCQLSIYCFSAPNHPFIACSVKIKMNPLNIFPLPDATILSFVCRGTGKTLQEEWFQCAPLGRINRVSRINTVSVFLMSYGALANLF